MKNQDKKSFLRQCSIESAKALKIESAITSLLVNTGDGFLEGDTLKGRPAEYALYELAVGLAHRGFAAKLSQLLSEAAEELSEHPA
jgi:hypothetical protein